MDIFLKISKYFQHDTVCKCTFVSPAMLLTSFILSFALHPASIFALNLAMPLQFLLIHVCCLHDDDDDDDDDDDGDVAFSFTSSLLL